MNSMKSSTHLKFQCLKVLNKISYENIIHVHMKFAAQSFQHINNYKELNIYIFTLGEPKGGRERERV